MTKEQLKEMALRLQKNNDQLKSDIAALSKERENDMSEINEKFMKFKEELEDVFRLIPVELMQTRIRCLNLHDEDAREMHFELNNGRLYYWRIRTDYIGYNLYLPYIFSDGTVDIDSRVHLEEVKKPDSIVWFVNNKQKVLDEAMDIVKNLLTRYNDYMVRTAQAAIEQTAAYKTAKETENGN